MNSLRSSHLIVKFRTIVFGIGVLFSLIALGTSAAFTAFVNKATGGAAAFLSPFAGLTLATSIITLITFPVLYWFGRQKNGVFKSQMFVELPSVCLLWILWIASAAQTAQYDAAFRTSPCSEDSLDFSSGFSERDLTCHEGRAMMAFGFLNWLLIMAYAFILTFYIFKAQNSTGTSTVWFSSVETFDWNGALLGGPNYAAKAAAIHNVHNAQVGANGAYGVTPQAAVQAPNVPMYNPHGNGAV